MPLSEPRRLPTRRCAHAASRSRRLPHPGETLGPNAATRALSVTEVDTEFIGRVYENLASIYDFTFGPILQAGRLRAIQRMDIDTGDRVLEVGVGTGINAPLYPGDCSVTGVDLSSSMLDKAHERVSREGICNVRLLEMDAAALKFPDASFDIVYAPYLISVVPDPGAVACEMRRVCRPGGRIVLLNHFRSAHPLVAWVERLISPLTVHIGFKSDLDLPSFLARTGLKPESIDKVNRPRIWSLVTCLRD